MIKQIQAEIASQGLADKLGDEIEDLEIFYSWEPMEQIGLRLLGRPGSDYQVTMTKSNLVGGPKDTQRAAAKELVWGFLQRLGRKT